MNTPGDVEAWVVRLAHEVLKDGALGYPRVAAGCSRGVGVGGGSMLSESDEFRAMRMALDELAATRSDKGRSIMDAIASGSACAGPDVLGINWLGERVDEILGDR